MSVHFSGRQEVIFIYTKYILHLTVKYDKAEKGLLSSKSKHKLLLFLSHAQLYDHIDCSTPGFPCPSLSPGVCLE